MTAIDSTTITPAAAGYFIVWPGLQRPNGYARVPIIGWNAETKWPVTMADDDDYPADTALECPDGMVGDLHDFGKWWPNVDAWLSEVRPRSSSPVRVAG